MVELVVPRKALCSKNEIILAVVWVLFAVFCFVIQACFLLAYLLRFHQE